MNSFADMIERRVARAGRTAALSLGGGLCLAVGLGFLTAAAWITLETIADARTAALVIGATYAGIGLILFVLAGRKPSRHHAPPPPAAEPVEVNAATIALALLQGIAAGAAAAGVQRRS